MPVTTSTITAPSGSRRSVKGTDSEPDSIQGATCCTIPRASGGIWTSDQNDQAAARKAPNMAAQATPPDAPLDRRLPIARLIRNPRNGSNGMRSSTGPLTTSDS
jgi:hypothetical protein